VAKELEVAREVAELFNLGREAGTLGPSRASPKGPPAAVQETLRRSLAVRCCSPRLPVA
jgi:hypothetical protein